MSVEIYGLSKCRKTQKALSWLKERNISFTFHAFLPQGISELKLTQWAQKIGYLELLNTKSPIFSRLPEAQQRHARSSPAEAIAVMAIDPRLIKRPVMEYNAQLLLGFDELAYASLFA